MTNLETYKWNLVIKQGATFIAKRRWSTQEDKDAPIIPVDFTNCIGRMHIRSNIKSPDILLEFSTDIGNMELDDGWVILKLTATETAAIDWKKGVYDLEIEFPDSFVRRLYAGTVTISKEVTRE